MDESSLTAPASTALPICYVASLPENQYTIDPVLDWLSVYAMY